MTWTCKHLTSGKQVGGCLEGASPAFGIQYVCYPESLIRSRATLFQTLSDWTLIRLRNYGIGVPLVAPQKKIRFVQGRAPPFTGFSHWNALTKAAWVRNSRVCRVSQGHYNTHTPKTHKLLRASFIYIFFRVGSHTAWKLVSERGSSPKSLIWAARPYSKHFQIGP